jgi:hypothetical protein
MLFFWCVLPELNCYLTLTTWMKPRKPLTDSR